MIATPLSASPLTRHLNCGCHSLACFPTHSPLKLWLPLPCPGSPLPLLHKGITRGLQEAYSQDYPG
eukprot:1160941-Pelagomonas_calceolata.AAC.7